MTVAAWGIGHVFPESSRHRPRAGELWRYVGPAGVEAVVLVVGVRGLHGSVCQCLWVSDAFPAYSDHAVIGDVTEWSLGNRVDDACWTRETSAE